MTTEGVVMMKELKPLKDLSPAVLGVLAIFETQMVLQRALEEDPRLSTYQNTEKLLLGYLAEPLRMGEIAETLGCLPSSVTALVDRLDAAGLAKRELDPLDRRAKRLVLTEKGKAVRELMIEAAADVFSKVTGLDEAGTSELVALLSRRMKPTAPEGTIRGPA
jgi:DNA-binding MarR family transcriptional regulator